MLSLKRIGAVVLALFLTIGTCQCTWASESDIAEVQCAVSNDTVTISGKVQQPGIRPVGIVVVKPGKSLSDITPGTAGSIVDQSLEIESAADGSFAVSYVVNGEKGTYTVYITTPTGLQPTTDTFAFCASVEILQAVNGATRGEIENVLMGYAPYMSIDMTANGLYGLLSAGRKSTVLDAMKETEFTSPEEIKAVFCREVSIGALSEATDNTIMAVMPELMSVIGSSLEEDYSQLSETLKVNVGKTMLAGKPYSGTEDATAQFEEGVILALIKQVGYPENENLLRKYSQTGVKLNGTYASLSPTKKGDILKDIARNDFYTYRELQTLFDNAVAQAARTSGSTSSGGGAGGGNGGAQTGFGNMQVNITPAAGTEATGGRFSDLDDVEWARESIEALSRRGIVAGVGDGRFEPNRPVTREEFVKLIVTAVGAMDSAPVRFTDVDTSEWYYPYIAIAAANGLVNGYPDGHFGVGEEISRQDMAVVLQRTAQMFGYRLTDVNDEIEFIDRDEIDDYAKEAVRVMQRAGLMNGTGGARFESLASATRAMAAKVIYEMIQIK